MVGMALYNIAEKEKMRTECDPSSENKCHVVARCLGGAESLSASAAGGGMS